MLSATAMTAAVAMAVAAQPIKIMGTRTIRAVPRSRMVARIATYSSSALTYVPSDTGLMALTMTAENYHKIRTAVVSVLNTDNRRVGAWKVNRITTFLGRRAI